MEETLKESGVKRRAAEAHVVELAGALGQIIPVLDRTNTTGEIRHGHDKVKRLVKAALEPKT